MDSVHTPGEAVMSVEQETSSLFSLLQWGLQCTFSIEQIAFLASLADLMSPNQANLTAALKAFTRSYTNYKSAQQALQVAGKQLIEADAELQANIGLLKMLLSNLVENINVSKQAMSQLFSTSQGAPLAQPPQPISNGIQLLLPTQTLPEAQHTLPTLRFTCFGHFEVRRLGHTVTICQNRKGQAILRYLLTQPGYRAAADSLMEVMCPDDELDVARRKLQVAISALRRSLNSGYTNHAGGGYILFKDSAYLLNPAASFRSDVDEFLEFYQTAGHVKETEAIAHYEHACHLYTGPFLAEDMYADWSFARREQLSLIFQKMCNVLAEHYLHTGHYEESIKWADAILKENTCDEAAHRHLMRAYAAQGRRSESLRQYQRCEHLLREELGVSPMPETVRLWQTILLCEHDGASIEQWR